MASDTADKKAQSASDDLVKKTKTRQQEVSVRKHMDNGDNDSLVATNQTADGDLDHTERKKKEDKKLNATLKLSRDIVSAIAAAEAAMRGFEDSLGGLDKMAEKLGLERKDNETEAEFRARIREEITARQIAGTLDDPDGYFAGWAGEYDKIEAHIAKTANDSRQTRQAHDAAKGDDAAEKQAMKNGSSNSMVAGVRDNAEGNFEKDVRAEVYERRDQGENQNTDSSISFASKEDSIEDFFGGAEKLDVKNTFNLQASGQAQSPEATQTADISEPVISNKMII